MRVKPGLHIDVWHGPWVETQPDRFITGAWDGHYEEMVFDQAEVLAGSGAILSEGNLRVVATNLLSDYVASAKVDDALYFSNSLVFLLARTGDDLDIKEPYYLSQYLRWIRHGYRWPHIDIATRDRTVRLYNASLLDISTDLQIQITRSPLPGPPDSYDSYVELLQRKMKALIENSQNPARKHPFQGSITAVSRGYDSPAVAVLARSIGSQDILTYYTDGPDGTLDYSDCGAEIGEHLGMNVHLYHNRDYKKLPGLPEAEFCANFETGMHVPNAIAEPILTGKILFRGGGGDRIWELREENNVPDFAYHNTVFFDGPSSLEFRLRIGALFIDVPRIAGHQIDAIYRIAREPEMTPWHVPGIYNRPIARRLIETAGVPREAFASADLATGHANLYMPYARRPELVAAYEQFVSENPVPEWFGDRPPLTLRNLMRLVVDYADRIFLRLPGNLRWRLSFVGDLSMRFLRPHRDARLTGRWFYLFHWAVSVLRGRYEI